MKKPVMLMSVLLLAAASGPSAASPLRFGYFEADYLQSETDGGTEGDGFRAALSFSGGPNSFLIAEYDEREFDEVAGVTSKSNYLSAGFGLHTNTRRVPSAAFFGAMTYEKVDSETDTALVTTEDSDDGYGLQVGVRGWAFNTLEVNASFKRNNYGKPRAGGDDVELDVIRAGLVFPVSRRVSLAGTYQMLSPVDGDSDTDEYLLGLRFALGAEGGGKRRRGR